MGELKFGPFCGAQCNRKASEIRIRFASPNPEKKNEKLTAVYTKGESGDWFYNRTLISVAPVKDSKYLVLEGTQLKFMEITSPLTPTPLPLRVWVCKELLN